MTRPRRNKPTRDGWGSITRRDDGRWRLRYSGPDGRRRSGGIFRTKAEAEEARARLHTSLASGAWRPAAPAGVTPTLADFSRNWLAESARTEQLSPRTVALYRRLLDRLVLPDVGGVALGQVPVGRLTRSLVETWEVAGRRHARELAAAHANRRKARRSPDGAGTRPGSGRASRA